MVLIPGRCRSCGKHVATPPLISIKGRVERLRVDDVVQISGCPFCGGDVEAIVGTMNVVDGAIQMLSGPTWSWSVVEDLGLALKQIAQHPPADPIAAIAEVAPDVAAAVRAATMGWTPERVIALLAVLATLITAVTGAYTALRPPTADPDDVKRQVVEILREASTSGEVPPPPPQPATPAP